MFQLFFDKDADIGVFILSLFRLLVASVRI
jgi:hypothetical protein